MEKIDWGQLSPEDKKLQLYLKQKELLDVFLSRGTITQAQYDKSFGDLTLKMGMSGYAAKMGWIKEKNE